jgi:hypothetical protein
MWTLPAERLKAIRWDVSFLAAMLSRGWKVVLPLQRRNSWTASRLTVLGLMLSSSYSSLEADVTISASETPCARRCALCRGHTRVARRPQTRALERQVISQPCGTISSAQWLSSLKSDALAEMQTARLCHGDRRASGRHSRSLLRAPNTVKELRSRNQVTRSRARSAVLLLSSAMPSLGEWLRSAMPQRRNSSRNGLRSGQLSMP